MTKGSFYKSHRRIILLLVAFSCISTFMAFNFGTAYGLGIGQTNTGSLVGGDIAMMAGMFGPLVGLGGSPFIVLTMLSGAGALLNTGAINPDAIPLSGALMHLPISNFGIFITLLVITGAKFLLSIPVVSKIFCDTLIGVPEDLVGTICSIGGTFLLSSVTTVYAAEIATSAMGNVGMAAMVMTSVVSFITAALGYAVYAVMKTMVAAVGILAFLFSPIPGATGLYTVLKHAIVASYTWVTLTDPLVSSIIGVIFVAVACIVFAPAKRLETYYRRIYIIPFFNAIFRERHRIPLMPKKLPRGVAEILGHKGIEMCIESYFMNKTSALHKRERCYLVRAGEANYIFKKRLFGKIIQFELPEEVYIEKPRIFRFLRIFSDESMHASLRKVNLVVRREHGQNFGELIEKAGFIDYNAILEERKRAKAEERAQKAQERKDQAVKKVKGIFAGKCKECGATKAKDSKFCDECGAEL